jgi:hypothetical protein
MDIITVFGTAVPSSNLGGSTNGRWCEYAKPAFRPVFLCG